MLADAWLPLVLFMALMLGLSVHGLAASGHFPREHRSPSLQGSSGAVILFGSLLIAAACLVVAVSTAWRAIPWYAAIIGGGLVVLATPLLLRPFPDAFVNGRGILLLFAGFEAAVAVTMIAIA